jgi:hypothetical protein
LRLICLDISGSLFPALSPRHGFGIIPAPGGFGASAFSAPSTKIALSKNAASRLGSGSTRFFVPRSKRAEKGEKQLYPNSIQIIGFVGRDPERRERQGGNAAYTVFPVATQRAWKNTDGAWQRRTEWHRVVAWNSTGESAARLKTGDHVHIQGCISSPALTSASTMTARNP